MIANPAIDVLGVLSELELRRVDADHDQADIAIIAVRRLDVGHSADPVDAGVLPEVDRDDLAPQHVSREGGRVYPAIDPQDRHGTRRAPDSRTVGSAAPPQEIPHVGADDALGNSCGHRHSGEKASPTGIHPHRSSSECRSVQSELIAAHLRWYPETMSSWLLERMVAVTRSLCALLRPP